LDVLRGREGGGREGGGRVQVHVQTVMLIRPTKREREGERKI
jgi:hypothetical protein